jgi:hypothetical protein
MPPTSSRRSGPTQINFLATTTSAPTLALEKVIQDHIPSVSAHLKGLLFLLTPSLGTSPLSSQSHQSLLVLERDLRRLCYLAQDGLKHMDYELRMIEAGWDEVDKLRWEVCKRDYKGAMSLVQQVWEAGQARMEELRGVPFHEMRTRTAGRR